MILLCGIPSEAPMHLVAEAAKRFGIDSFCLSQRDLLDTQIRLGADPRDGVLHHAGTEVSLADIRGVYVRWMDVEALPEMEGTGGDETLRQRLRTTQARIQAWIDHAPCRVMNRRRDMASNASKPYQMQRIAAAGFTVPETLVTNDPTEARQFLRRHRRVIFKSISAERSKVRLLHGPNVLELAKICFLPTQFQAFVPGVNVRVHVVGDRVLATEVRSDAVDYRYPDRAENVDLRPVELARDLRSACRSLSRRLRLPLCGIDLKRTPEGDHVCFEVNPSPAFNYYQTESGQDIARAIVCWLDAG